MKVAKITFCILWVIDKNIETQKSPEEFPFLITSTKLLFTTCQGKCFLLFSKSVPNCSQFFRLSIKGRVTDLPELNHSY